MEGQFAPPPYQQQPTGRLVSRSAARAASARADPDFTPPERITVETPQQTVCPGCKKQIRTQVLQKRGKLERNRLTDAVFKTVAILVVPFDQEFIHSCPSCQQRFKIYSMRPHQKKHAPQEGLSYAPPPPYQRRDHATPAARHHTRKGRFNGGSATGNCEDETTDHTPESELLAQDPITKTGESHLVTKMV